MFAKDRQTLGKALWTVSEELRGSMNADDFRDHILAFLFLRYLSATHIYRQTVCSVGRPH